MPKFAEGAVAMGRYVKERSRRIPVMTWTVGEEVCGRRDMKEGIGRDKARERETKAIKRTEGIKGMDQKNGRNRMRPSYGPFM